MSNGRHPSIRPADVDAAGAIVANAAGQRTPDRVADAAPPALPNVVPMVSAARRQPEGAVPPKPVLSKPGATPQVVPYPAWQNASQRVCGALFAGETRLLVAGPAGTGKSLLLDNVARVVRAAGWTATIRQVDASPLPGQTGPSVLLIDEADRIPPAELAALMKNSRVPVVLAGLDVLASRLPSVTKVALPGLTREEARDYIAQWLTLTGRSPANLETAGMRHLVELSGGVPRLLSTLLAAASWLAQSAGETVLTQHHVEEAASLRSTLAPAEPAAPPGQYGQEAAAALTPAEKRRGTILAPALSAALLLGVAGFVAARYFPDELRGLAGATGQHLAGLQSNVSQGMKGWIDPARDAQTLPLQAAPPASPAPPAPAQPQAAATIEPAPPVVPTPAPEPPAPVAEAPTAAPPAAIEEPTPTPPAEAQAADTAAPPAQPQADTPPVIPTIEAAPAPVIASEPAPIVAPEPAPVIAPKPSPVVVANVAPAAAPVSRAMIDLLLRRGKEMLAVGDVSAARLLLGRAADAGNADAMLELGRTFDPAVLARADLMATADPQAASAWYRRAAEAGNREAAALLGPPIFSPKRRN